MTTTWPVRELRGTEVGPRTRRRPADSSFRTRRRPFLESSGRRRRRCGTPPSVTATGHLVGPRRTSFGEVAGLELQATLERRNFGLDWQAELPEGSNAVGWEVEVNIDLLLLKAAEGRQVLENVDRRGHGPSGRVPCGPATRGRDLGDLTASQSQFPDPSTSANQLSSRLLLFFGAPVRRGGAPVELKWWSPGRD
jgi:hypothetical protein